MLKHLRLLPLAALLAAPSIHAAGLDAAQVLNQFNLVTHGSAKSSSDTDGRAYVGGALNGGVWMGHGDQAPASAYAGVTVGGSAAGVTVNRGGAVVGGAYANGVVNGGGAVVHGSASNVNFNGSVPAYVAGATSGTNFNGGRVFDLGSNATLQGYANAAHSTDFDAVLGGLSQQLSTLSSTGSTVTFNGNKATFHAVANGAGLAVFDLTAIDTTVFSKGEFEFDFGSATTVVFNTDVTSATIAANFLGGSAQAIGRKAIWNFYAAEDLWLKNQFGGSVLAWGADLRNDNNIEGGVFVDSIDQRGELHLQPFGGTLPVPEPGTWALMALGLAVVARRRSAAH